MFRSIMALMVMAAVLLAGCSDDDDGNGGGLPLPNNCADVGGTWSMALQVDSGWFGGVLSSITVLDQSDTCTVTGTMVLGPELEGFTTRDSLYFIYGMPGAAPEDQVYCALEIVDEYLMEGQYAGTDGSGAMTMHGPDPDCSGTVEMQVSAGLEPTFSWQPRCSASLMLIEPVDSGADQWSVGNENENALDSGLTYGVAPAGVQSGTALPLVAGQTYKAILYRWLGEDDAYLMVEYEVFTP
ncbi:MAG: hypothetical protein ABFS42_13335 [Candidatus Krumholzibacteriota bacterium]